MNVDGADDAFRRRFPPNSGAVHRGRIILRHRNPSRGIRFRCTCTTFCHDGAISCCSSTRFSCTCLVVDSLLRKCRFCCQSTRMLLHRSFILSHRHNIPLHRHHMLVPQTLLQRLFCTSAVSDAKALACIAESLYLPHWHPMLIHRRHSLLCAHCVLLPRRQLCQQKPITCKSHHNGLK